MAKTTKKQDAALETFWKTVIQREKIAHPDVHVVLVQRELRNGLLFVTVVLRSSTLRIIASAVIDRKGQVSSEHREECLGTYTPGRVYLELKPVHYVLERRL